MTAPVSTRSHFYDSVRDSDGNVTPNVKVTLYERGSTQLLQQTIYTSPAGSLTLTNPFTTSSGIIDFYLAEPQDVAIGISVEAQGGVERRIEDVGVLPPSDQLVRSPVGFQVMNAPFANAFMQASDERTAYWVSADQALASHATPIVTIKQYDFSASYLDDLKIVGANSFVDVSLDVKPLGYGFLQALTFSTSVATPMLHFPERGWAVFAYKIVSGKGGQGAARLQVSTDDKATWTLSPSTPEYVDLWCVAYLEVMVRGTHQVLFEQLAGTDTDSHVLLGPITIAYGNNIPAHVHAGSPDNTVVLGTDASVLGVRATALGAETEADVDAVATGYHAVADLRGVAVGSGAWAAQDSLAAGYRAGGIPGTTDWIALGALAATSGDDAVAVGYDAAAAGRAVAVGYLAAGTKPEAIAIGTQAIADGYRSIAIGAGAVAAFDYSVAIGPGVLTQAAHEARLGDDATVVVVPGSMRHVGPSAVLGAAGTRLGFYGAASVAQPVVRGSRSNNQVLGQLLAALDTMGLIDDRSTAS